MAIDFDGNQNEVYTREQSNDLHCIHKTPAHNYYPHTKTEYMHSSRLNFGIWYHLRFYCRIYKHRNKKTWRVTESERSEERT